MRAPRGKTLVDLGRTTEGVQELHAAVKDLEPMQQSSPNLYWEPLALFVPSTRWTAPSCRGERLRPAGSVGD